MNCYSKEKTFNNRKKGSGAIISFFSKRYNCPVGVQSYKVIPKRVIMLTKHVYDIQLKDRKNAGPIQWFFVY
jgi:hypothetical protein